MAATSYFTAVSDDTFTPTEHCGGAWNDEDLHFSPVGGLLIHHMERWRAQHSDPNKLISRITFDILGVLARGEIQLETRLIRAGRTIELLETVASIGGRPVITARAWAMSPVDTADVAEPEWEPITDPESIANVDITGVWPGGYIRSLTLRQADGARPGRAQAWIRSDISLVEGQESTALVDFVKFVDTANGVAVREQPDAWMFPNLDLTIHFFRQPRGPWTGFDTTVAFGPTGQGLTSTVLHDVDGAVGTAAQTLTVRPIG